MCTANRFRWLSVLAGLATVTATFGAPTASRPDFFPSADLMRLGVYYYPEAWPTNQWERDIANIKKLGFEFVHMGEFAWAFMEPREGQFNLDWLEANVRLCAEQGLKVVLCTPSPTPPIWLVQKYPEVLMVDSQGLRMQHGSREQACWSVEAYRRPVARVVDELGRRFGKDPRVWGWQLDNELSHYGKHYCYCGACQSKFQAWLQQKYGTIDDLNRDWGNAFWSQMYERFDQIRIPNPDELVQQVNPHALLDFQRWFAIEAADYLRFQAGLLRQYCGTNQWITHNFMHLHGDVSPPLSGGDLDLISWTLYPAHGNLERDPQGFRLGNGAEISFSHDFQRSINGAQGLMELQPGQVNWGDANPQPYPGAVYLWIMRAFGGGAKLTCSYRYRQPLSGGELYHYGMVGPDGVTPTTGGQQFARAATDLALLRKNYRADATEPAANALRRTALLFSTENRWDIDNHKQTTRWNTMDHVVRLYRGLKRLGAPVDVITEDKDFAKYRFLVAPAYQLVDQQLVERWTHYAEAGGHLVLTCRTAQKDRRGHLWEAPWAGPIQDLIGAAIPAYDVLPGTLTGRVKMSERTYEWAAWGDLLAPREGTTVLATYADQFYNGTPAATTRRFGQGTVTYIGVDSVQGDFEAELLRGVFLRADVPVVNLPDQVIVDWRDGFWVATNFTSQEQSIPTGPHARFFVGARKLPPAGVAVWSE